MTNIDPDQIAAFDQLAADLDPRITLTVEMLSFALRTGMPIEMVFKAAIQTLHGSYDSTEILAAIAALTLTRIAQVNISIEDHMAEHHD